MQENTKLSVLMANFNRSNFIEEAIQSILNQTYTNFELLILDDYSTDNSVVIIEKFKDERIHLYKNTENKGAGFCKAFLAKNATGFVSAFFDSDDVLDKTALEKMMKLHIENPTKTIIYSNHFVCDENLKIIKKGSSRKIPKGENHLTYFGISHFVSYKTQKYFETEGIDDKLTKAVDQDLYYKLEETGESLFLDDCLYYYRHNSNSISLNKNATFAFENKLHVMQNAIERRKNSNVKYPSNLYMKWLKMKYIDNKKMHQIPIFVSINYLLYLIKIKFKNLV